MRLQPRPVHTLAFDPAWGGTGWCVATEAGPLLVGHELLRGEWRLQRLDAFLSRLETMVPADCAPCIERPPPVYTGATRVGGAGNQSEFGFGMGCLVGPLAMWAFRRFAVGLGRYPFMVEVDQWRGWWQIGRGKRPVLKQRAISRVQVMGWGRHLEPWFHHQEPDSPLGDVAEAILQAVGYARHPECVPRGPKNALS